MNDAWIQTFTGKKFYPLNPSKDDIDIHDIAHALSNLCRFNGHCNKFYSVAEHCVHVSNILPSNLQLKGLLHDAAEAYLSDVSRPVKPHLRGYSRFEYAIMWEVYKKFNLTLPINESLIKDADNAILSTEYNQVMTPYKYNWHLAQPAANIEIKCWSPEDARNIFLLVFEKLKEEK